MEQAMAYVCCPAEESRVRCSDIAGRFMSWDMFPFVRGLDFFLFWMKGKLRICRHTTGCPT